MVIKLNKPDNSGKTRVNTTPRVAIDSKNGITRVIGTVPQSMSSKITY